VVDPDRPSRRTRGFGKSESLSLQLLFFGAATTIRLPRWLRLLLATVLPSLAHH
jgi:hypothetical protein